MRYASVTLVQGPQGKARNATASQPGWERLCRPWGVYAVTYSWLCDNSAALSLIAKQKI